MVSKNEDGSWVKPDGVWKDWFGPHTGIPDFTNPETSKYWYKSRIKDLITDGTYFWWNDLSEPEVLNQTALFQGVGQVTESGQLMHEMKQAPEAYNYHQFLWTKGLSDEYDDKLNKRYNVLVRAGTCGIQRYGAFMWPGDANSDLDSMNINEKLFKFFYGWT